MGLRPIKNRARAPSRALKIACHERAAQRTCLQIGTKTELRALNYVRHAFSTPSPLVIGATQHRSCSSREKEYALEEITYARLGTLIHDTSFLTVMPFEAPSTPSSLTSV